MGGEENTSNGGTGSSMVKTIQNLNIHQPSKMTWSNLMAQTIIVYEDATC